MKTLYIALFMTICCCSGVHSQSHANKFFDQLKKTSHYEGFSLPGWVLRLGLKVAMKKGELSAEDNNVLFLLEKVKHFKMATTHLDPKIFNIFAIQNNFVNKLVKDDHFEEYIKIKSEDTNLRILIDEKKGIVRNLIILGTESNEMTIIQIKTKLKLSDLSKLSFKDIKKKSQNFKRV